MNQEGPPPFSPSAHQVQVGCIYRHYKGLRYKVLARARHSESLEEMVVYQSLYGNGDIWVRPIEMFMESVEVDGALRARFQCEGDL